MKKFNFNNESEIEDGLVITPIETEEELNVIAKLYQQANPHATFKNIVKYTKKTWKKSNNLILKAVINEEIVGAISIEIEDDIALVDDIAITSTLQKTGIGRKLWEFCENVLKIRGIKIVKGQVHYIRAEIIPFCYKNGFRLNRVVKDGFGLKEDYIEIIKHI